MPQSITPVSRNRTQRVLAVLFFVAVLFPYLSPFKTPFDTQPWALLVSFAVALTFFDIPRPLFPLFFTAGYASLVLAIGLIRGVSAPVDGLRSLAGYLSVFFIAYAGYRLHKFINVKLFLAGVGVWFAVGIIQILFDPTFLNGLLPRITPFDKGGRGVIALAPEPAYYVKVLIAFFVLNEIFFKEKRYGPRLYAAIFVLICIQVVISFAGIGVIFLAAAAVAKAISLLWEKTSKDRIVSAVLILVLIAGFASFKTIPRLQKSRGGSFLSKAIRDPLTLYWRDRSTSGRLGNLVLGSYGGLIQTKGIGFGLGTKTQGPVPRWLGRTIGARRKWGGRISGGLVQGVYELGAVGLLFFFTPLWIIGWSFVKNRDQRSALWLTLCLVYPIAAIAESPAFPLFGYLLGIHVYYLKKNGGMDA